VFLEREGPGWYRALGVVPGGAVAFDHYFSPNWPSTLGERIAAKEMLTSEEEWFNLHGTGIFIKMG
jgi:hypothetical protein